MDIDYRGKVVLITGANGFLGRHLVKRLSETCTIHCVTRSMPRESCGNIQFSCVDLRDEAGTLRLFERVRPDVVFHLASASGGSIDVRNVLPHLQDDIVTTANCLVAAQLTSVHRFVIPGSTDEPCGSDVPDSPYSMAKSTCVTYGRMFHKLYKTPTVICRIFMTYGPGQKTRKILPYIIRSMLAGESPKLASASRLVDWIYIDDTINALLLAGVKQNIEGEILEIGSGELVSIGEIATRIQQLIPGALPAVASDHPFYGRSRCADLRTRDLLGWSPMTSLKQGLMDTVEWYRQNS